MEKYDQLDEKEFRRRYHAEDNGWSYCSDFATDVLIRNDLYDKMNQVYYEAEHRDLEHSDCYRLLRSVLKPKHDMPRKIYKKTQENLDREEQERKKRECKLAKIRLEASDLKWKPLHLNNIISNSVVGYYAFLFKRQGDGQISGYKWTVLCQPKEEEHGKIGTPAVIEAYNLYFKEYRNVAGVLGYMEPAHSEWLQCYEKSTIHDGIHSYGRFVRSYQTLELAKEAALLSFAPKPIVHMHKRNDGL